MDVEPNRIKLYFYKDQQLEIQTDTGIPIFTHRYEGETYAAGFYDGKDGDSNYVIALETGQLTDPNRLIATLAHEIAHIKLLGEERVPENDESLTDITTVFFGLGIFNANAAFNFRTSFDRWEYSKQGYLTQQEWGYALALYAYVRSEQNPSWLKYLTKNIQADYRKSESYIYSNTDKVLVI